MHPAAAVKAAPQQANNIVATPTSKRLISLRTFLRPGDKITFSEAIYQPVQSIGMMTNLGIAPDTFRAMEPIDLVEEIENDGHRMKIDLKIVFKAHRPARPR